MTRHIDWDKVDQYFICGCNIVQACAALGLHRNTLYERCEKEKNCTLQAYFEEKREKGNTAIHAAQFEKAIKEKNPTMLIWLGKQRLGQKEILDEKVTKEIEKRFDEQMNKIMELLNPSEELKIAIGQDFDSQRNIDDSSINNET